MITIRPADERGVADHGTIRVAASYPVAVAEDSECLLFDLAG